MNSNITTTVSHCGLAIYIKMDLKSKRRRKIMETQIFHHAKIYLIFKKSSKRNPKSFKIL
jgi:hypothetical protein